MSKYLANRFSRITVDFSHMDGQACIRSLPITVSEVAKLAASGKSSTEIIAQYPDLEVEDIHQALAYGIAELVEVIALWRSEGLTPLSSIKGYSELLLSGHISSEQFSAEQKHFFQQTIAASSYRAIDIWHHLGFWSRIKYGSLWQEWRSTHISEVVNSVVRSLNQRELTAIVDVQIPENLPLIRCNDYLELAILYLISDRTIFYSDAKATLVIKLKNSSDLNMVIRRPFEFIPTTPISEHLFWESSPFSVARYILRQHKSELKINASETHITFEFDLPIWNESDKKLS